MRKSANSASRCLERVDQSVELVEDLLEPQLARLVHDDEQQLVRMLGHGARTLQREQLVEREVGPVGDLAVGCRWASLKTSLPRATTTSSTRIISVVKNGSP